jgi:hypothetical protein
MELGRLLPKPLVKLGHRYRGFREFLAEVLEGNRSLIGDEAIDRARPQFEVSSDFKKLISSRNSRQRSMSEMFTSLAPFFEAGALLVQKQGSSRLSGLFVEGRTFLNEKDTPPIQLGLAALQSGVVVKGRNESVLRALGLQDAKRLSEADVFAFSPRSGFVFVLVCNRPPLWQIEALEAAFTFAVDEVIA